MRFKNEIIMYKLVRSNEEFNYFSFINFVEFYISIISFSEIMAHFLNDFLH